jgi:hypothetical protein
LSGKESKMMEMTYTQEAMMGEDGVVAVRAVERLTGRGRQTVRALSPRIAWFPGFTRSRRLTYDA